MREEIIDDEEGAIKYLQTGHAKTMHNCQEMARAVEDIQQLISIAPTSSQVSPRAAATPTREPAQGTKRKPRAPPGSIVRYLATERRSRETSSPPNTPRAGSSQFIEATCLSEDEDSDVEIINVTAASQRERPYASPPPSPQPIKRGASPASQTAPARKRRHKAFKPTGFQLKGVTIIYNKHRSEGASYLVQWLAKPTITTWLREEDVARYSRHPEACREYLTDLAHSSPRRFSYIARAAGPMSELLD